MSKDVVAALVVVVVFVAGGFLLLGGGNDNNQSANQATSETANGDRNKVDACSVMSLDNAAKALGETVERAEDTNTGASSDDIDVTQCTYQTIVSDIASAKEQLQASLLARSAKTDSGAESNRAVFGEVKPEGVQDVGGYGDAAFWNPQFGQLNILKGDNWYILQVGSSIPSARTLDDAKKLADQIIAKL